MKNSKKKNVEIMNGNASLADKLDSIFDAEQVEIAIRRRVGVGKKTQWDERRARACLEAALKTAGNVAMIDEYGECDWKDAMIETKLHEMLEKIAARWGFNGHQGVNSVP